MKQQRYFRVSACIFMSKLGVLLFIDSPQGASVCVPRPGEGTEWGLGPELQAHPTNPLFGVGASLRGSGQAGTPREGLG